MRRLYVLLSVALLFPVFARAENPGRGLYVSMIEAPQALSSPENIRELIQFSKKTGLDALFVQVYRANKSWFPSKTADDSLYRAALKAGHEDPLALLIREAHASNIQVHAWMNLLSLSGNEDAPILKKYGPAILTKNKKTKKRLADYKIDNQYFLDPASSEVKKETLALLDEVLGGYPELDGLQFDYIRYPDVDPETDPVKKDLKRAKVTFFLEGLVRHVRGRRPGIQISTTGCVPYVRAYHEALQDWPSWLDRGLVDFVTVMNYSADPEEFRRFLEDAKKRTKHPSRMNIAVGAYKLATTPASFAKQWRLCESSGCGECVAFFYGNFRSNPALAAPLEA